MRHCSSTCRILSSRLVKTSQAQHARNGSDSNTPQWRRLELTVTRYLNRFVVHIRDDDLYVVKQLQHSSTIVDEFTVYSSNKFKASSWAITVRQHSTAKAVKQRLAGNPYRERVAANEFNLLAGAMPLLDLPDRDLTEAEELALKDILDHILNSLVSGNQRDYDIFMDWMDYIAQNPDRKIAYMHVFMYKHNFHCWPFITNCVQGSENVCKLGLVINRSAAKKQKDKISKALKSGPEPVQSALDMIDSSDEEQ
ncbi:TPA: hypothetical protein ACH3X3_007171 [Trebouxia sp. C0006]